MPDTPPDGPPDSHCTHCPGSHAGRRPCLASATPKARAWLLIEHPGPWAESVAETALPTPVADAVARAAEHGVRAQLIRRTRRRRATPPLTVYAGRSAPTGTELPWLERRDLADPAELADLDLEAVGAGRPPGFGAPVSEPLFLVCTHGRHNVCCARTGGPLARSLAASLGDAVWETTHVGGDRFAANLVCLPHGLYYGDLDEARALDATAAYLRGEVALERYRGRAGLPEEAQAAEHFVRAATGVLDVNGIVVESVKGGTAVIRAGATRYRVRVERKPVNACGPGCEENLRTHVLRGFTLLSTAALV